MPCWTYRLLRFAESVPHWRDNLRDFAKCRVRLLLLDDWLCFTWWPCYYLIIKLPKNTGKTGHRRTLVCLAHLGPVFSSFLAIFGKVSNLESAHLLEVAWKSRDWASDADNKDVVGRRRLGHRGRSWRLCRLYRETSVDCSSLHSPHCTEWNSFKIEFFSYSKLTS